ncbi:hypothetical protein ASD77_17340 [Pseudoxanthomonas sp. Root65]|nr:hypothetical protein ASD77_17340 [Pseudoxanthomonas sp. Root65]
MSLLLHEVMPSRIIYILRKQMTMEYQMPEFVRDIESRPDCWRALLYKNDGSRLIPGRHAVHIFTQLSVTNYDSVVL